ncbi:MAG: hypothetical protein V1816_23570 [Pseudomonadota bacterium]
MKKAAPIFYFKLVVFVLSCLLISGAAALSWAQETKPTKPPLNDKLLDSYRGKIEVSYILPRPAVIAEVLRKNKFVFTGRIAPNKTDEYPGSAKAALNLGSRCTDGVMMIYGDSKASDQELEELGAVIVKLTEDLGLKGNLKEIDQLKKALKDKNQKEIKKSIDLLFAETGDFLRQRDDDDLAMLVSLGGWIELMYYASEELSKNYQEQSSKVLAMAYIVDVYIKALDRLKIFVQDTPALATISGRLPELKQLMQTPPNRPLSQEAVAGIFTIAKNLKQEIEK